MSNLISSGSTVFAISAIVSSLQPSNYAIHPGLCWTWLETPKTIFLTMWLILQELINEGHAASQLIMQLHDKLVQLDELQDTPKSVVMEKLAVNMIKSLTHKGQKKQTTKLRLQNYYVEKSD